jgi:outer membrane immunogenic protein
MITKTKLLLLGTVFALGATATLGNIALAADLPRKAPAAAPIYPPPVASWAGCYLGGTVGAVQARREGGFDTEGGTVREPLNNTSKTGGIYGGYLGCNWQSRAFVYGIEGDFSGISGIHTSQLGRFDTDYGFSAKLNWLATIRGRAGLAVDNAMLYLTGGAAFAHTQVSAFDFSTSDSFSNTRTGWTVGAGIEYMFTPNWIGRGEFLYAAFNDNTVNFPNTGYSSTISHDLMIGRIGLAYKW